MLIVESRLGVKEQGTDRSFGVLFGLDGFSMVAKHALVNGQNAKDLSPWV